MPASVILRDVLDSDLPIFFEHQRDPASIHMAAFLNRDPNDRAAFDAHWKKILADPSTFNQTIVFEGEVAGNVAKYMLFGKPDVAYRIARAHWGKGIATAALTELLRRVQERPIYGHVAKDNIGSLRVLEKCGFNVIGYERGFAMARGEEIEEVVLELT